MEIPGQGTSTTSGCAMTTQTLPTSNSNQSSSVRQVDNSSDDPLAAIMNQTIFGGNFFYHTEVHFYTTTTRKLESQSIQI